MIFRKSRKFNPAFLILYVNNSKIYYYLYHIIRCSVYKTDKTILKLILGAEVEPI
jgi:hypothetical protein